MRATIIVDDNYVVVDGKAQVVDCSALDAEGIQAVQWYDNNGEVEFITEFDSEKLMAVRKPNETITDFSPYQSYVDAWQVKEDAEEPIPELDPNRETLEQMVVRIVNAELDKRL